MQTSKKKKLIVANSFLLLFLTVGCVFAWFATNYSNEIDSNQVEVVAGNALELSLTGNDWKSNIDLAKGLADVIEYEADGEDKFIASLILSKEIASCINGRAVLSYD